MCNTGKLLGNDGFSRALLGRFLKCIFWDILITYRLLLIIAKLALKMPALPGVIAGFGIAVVLNFSLLAICRRACPLVCNFLCCRTYFPCEILNLSIVLQVGGSFTVVHFYQFLLHGNMSSVCKAWNPFLCFFSIAVS